MRRTLVVTALAGALALVPGVAHAHGHPPRHVNHAPDRPSDVRTTAPDSACSATPVAVRSTTPTLRAVLTDPDGDALTGTFEVHGTAREGRVWTSGATGTQASGSDHAVQVPDGVLRDGGTYEWRVRAVDTKNRRSAVVRCRVAVDTTAPGQPTVAPVEGAGALYAEGTTAGGVGVAGAFTFTAPASDGVVAFRYEVDGVHAEVAVARGASAATVSWVPTAAGPHRLTVQAVDAAGNVGPEESHRFTVASPAPAAPGSARWALDEGTGTSAADALAPGSGPDLTLSPSVTWTDGMRNELWGSTTDLAIELGGTADTATSDGPVLDTSGSWSVAAVLRPATLGSTATVVSQDGPDGSAFSLGVRTVGCADDAPACWSLTVAGAAGSEPTTVTGGHVVPGAWQVVFGVRDAASGRVRVDVCHLGSVDEPGSPDVVPSEAAHEGGVPATGVFRVGGAPAGPTPWVGAVSGVQTWDSAIGAERERLVCTRGI